MAGLLHPHWQWSQVRCILSHMQPYKQKYRRKLLKRWEANHRWKWEPSAFQTLLVAGNKNGWTEYAHLRCCRKPFDVNRSWPLGHVRVTSLRLHRRTSYAIYDKVPNSKATSKRMRAVEGDLPPEIFGMPGTLEKLQHMSSYISKHWINTLHGTSWDEVSMMF